MISGKSLEGGAEINGGSMNGKTIFITGGTGSFATAYTKHLLKNHTPKKIILFSRNEDHRRQSQKLFSDYKDSIRWFTGDVRDIDRLRDAMKGVDIVIHAAAMKDIDICNSDPLEAVKTNVLGTANVMQVCQRTDTVEKAIFISTDKAVSPCNLYGSTKMTAEKLWMASNFLAFKFSVCRYGNVVRSRGSVLNAWLDKRAALKEHEELVLHITTNDMTRFWLEYSDAIHCVKKALELPVASTVISKTRSFRLVDLGIAFDATIIPTGIRPGEKEHETLIGYHELSRAIEYDDCYVIKPEYKYKEIPYEYEPGLPVEYDVNSYNADKFSVEELKRKIG
jgi:FlaA1/EpsC-like NDP-sugar epimerase